MASSHKASNKAVFNLNRNWGWLLGFGILFIILGCIGFSMVVGLTLASMFFFAALLVIAGLSHVVDVFKHKDLGGIFWQALIAVLYISAGCVVFYDPFLASTLITGILAAILIIIGITRIVVAVGLKDSSGWGFLLFAGLAAIFLGLLILAQWPMSGLWVIGMFIAIEMLITGWTYVFIALSLRRSMV
jgi:uncharacterized membrane protein HdeD (DUF308 family)